MTLELLKPHTHAGVRLAAGSRLEVDESTARWLIALGVARAPIEYEANAKPHTPSRKGD